jgi:Cu(I)/Ag(I) efflux system membrane fusion protein
MPRNRFFLTAAIVPVMTLALAGCGKAPVASTPSPETASPKILYWVDPMHPAYKSDKAGKAPDCGMDLVPVYQKSDEKPAPPSASPAERGGRKVLYWYDPMQPGTHFDHPGKSPSMNMEMVPKYADEAPPQGGPPGATVELSPQAIGAAGVATAAVRMAPLYRVVRAEGVLGTDETRLVHIAARVDGRLDRLDLDFTGQSVRRGAPIYSIYSPDLVSSGREYALALENLARARAGGNAGYVESAESLAAAARERLALWGLDRDQIDRIAATRHAEIDLVVRSPVSGTVLEKKVVQGQYVTAGQDLFLLADLSRLWLSAKVYEQELGGIKVGQLAVARFAAFPGRDFQGRVRFIDPVLDPATRTVGVRVELPNPGGLLKPGMFATAELRVDLGRGLAIPKSAVLDTGVRQVVYVQVAPGRFTGREVRLGPPAGELVQVVEGLAEGERVVTAASFLIDSQSQLATGQSIQWGGASEVKPRGRRQ